MPERQRCTLDSQEGSHPNMRSKGSKLGQNFLIDETACVRIADALGDARERTVVEIGPGHGAITALLALRCRRLHCIEFDPALARELAFRYRNQPQVTIHHADILQTDLAALLADDLPSGQTADIVGNLPYYITSEILLHLFAAAREGLLRRAIVMVQREVADRMAAQPGSSDYGALSALVQLHAAAQTLFTLPPSAFSPPPDVFSTVVRLDFASRFDALGIAFEPFNRFLRSTFAQKRKTLANNLKAAGYTSAQLEAVWPAGVPVQVRSEAVPLDDLAALYRALEARSPLP